MSPIILNEEEVTMVERAFSPIRQMLQREPIPRFVRQIILLSLLTVLFSSYAALAQNQIDPPVVREGVKQLSSVAPQSSLQILFNSKSENQKLIFIPLVMRNLSHSQPPQPAPTATPGPTATPVPAGEASFFLPFTVNGETNATDGPSVSIDAQGGVHIAYAAQTSDSSGKRPAYYAYCATDCYNPANFSSPVLLGDRVDHVNMSLDPAGRPRLLWIGPDPNQQNLMAYHYAQCNTGCTNHANWTETRLVGTDATEPHNSRNFAISEQGTAGFVYFNDLNKGIYYRYCSNNCATIGNWNEVKIFDSSSTFPSVKFSSLAYTKTGEPRIAAVYLDTIVDPALEYVLYIECGATCQTLEIGAAFNIRTCYLCDWPKGYFRLALDVNDRPRLALYTGPVETGNLDPERLYYLWCNTSCGDPNNSDWGGYSMGLDQGVGTYVDLVIDQAGRPRLAFEDVSYGLNYAWCTANCETTNPSWNILLADASADLDKTEPVPPIPPCQVAGWFTGKRPSIALDAQGNPRIAHDAEHWQGLNPIDHPPGKPGCGTFRMDQLNSRFTIFKQP
jgi:hypothetical protein